MSEICFDYIYIYSYNANELSLYSDYRYLALSLGNPAAYRMYSYLYVA